jgi:hypothetical protein
MRALAGQVSEPRAEALSRQGAIKIAAGWALVHGLAVLVVEKRPRGVAKRAPGFSELIDLAYAVVESVSIEIVENRASSQRARGWP